MKAKPAAILPGGEEWLYELKLDGFRFLGATANGVTKLWSRTRNDFTARFPAVAEALAGLQARSALVDGELVVTDAEGRPSFQLIQNADEHTPVRAFPFDLLAVDGKDLRHESLQARRMRLAALLPKRSSVVLMSNELTGDPDALLAEVARRGLEGIIAKQRDSRYEAGRRSGAWLKVKCFLEQEFVIGGFTAPKGSRSHFGSMLVGYYEGARLIFAGKVGTGFDEKMLRDLSRRMLAQRASRNPFASLPAEHGRWGAGLSRAELARCTWLEPHLVAQVRFAEWTGDAILRQPSFMGLREDIRPRDVVRET